MAVPFWQPGQLYQPGDIVRPTSAGSVAQSALQNPSFEEGATGWTLGAGGALSIGQDAGSAFDGEWRLAAADNGTGQFPDAVNDARIAVKPGQLVSAACMVMCISTPDDTRAGISIRWFSSSMASLGKSQMLPDTSQLGGHDKVEPEDGGLVGLAADNFWTQITVGGVAPAGAAFFTIAAEFGWHPDGAWRVDKFTLDYAGQEAPNPFLFRATQAEAGFSGSAEPTWPTVLGQQVVDNEVTWEAVAGSNIVWEAHRILVSGATEPAFPTAQGAAVADNAISWVLDPRRVTDAKAPRSPIIAIAASKVFAGAGDIVPFCATINPLDWVAPEDAGYLPTGLQSYGSNPVSALGLYRSNLIVFNSEGFQMWQVDEDPANMALLDSGPVGCDFHRSGQPVANDWVFLTNVGIRNIGIAGASTNLQAGFFGKAVDELVKAKIKELGIDKDPIGLTYPGAGQYWLIFGNEAIVLTMNGGKSDMSWSTYTFPSAITDWTILNRELYLRSGDKVWRVDPDALLDDQTSPESVESYGAYPLGIAPASPWQLGDFEYVATSPAFLSVASDASGFSLAAPYTGARLLRSSGSASAMPFLLRRADGELLNLTSLRIAADANATITVKGFLSATAAITDLADFTQTVDVSAGNPVPVTDALLDMPGIRAVAFSSSAGSEMYLVELGYEGAPEGEEFEGELRWHYLDSGVMGEEVSLEAFDLVCEGVVDVSFGYNQKNEALATAPYTVEGDTLPDDPIPMPLTGPSLQFRLTFHGNQRWKWTAAKLYM